MDRPGFPEGFLYGIEPYLDFRSLSALARVCKSHMMLVWLRAKWILRWDETHCADHFREEFGNDAFLMKQIAKLQWVAGDKNGTDFQPVSLLFYMREVAFVHAYHILSFYNKCEPFAYRFRHSHVAKNILTETPLGRILASIATQSMPMYLTSRPMLDEREEYLYHENIFALACRFWPENDTIPFIVSELDDWANADQIETYLNFYMSRLKKDGDCLLFDPRIYSRVEKYCGKGQLYKSLVYALADHKRSAELPVKLVSLIDSGDISPQRLVRKLFHHMMTNDPDHPILPRYPEPHFKRPTYTAVKCLDLMIEIMYKWEKACDSTELVRWLRSLFESYEPWSNPQQLALRPEWLQNRVCTYYAFLKDHGCGDVTFIPPSPEYSYTSDYDDEEE